MIFRSKIPHTQIVRVFNLVCVHLVNHSNGLNDNFGIFFTNSKLEFLDNLVTQDFNSVQSERGKDYF